MTWRHPEPQGPRVPVTGLRQKENPLNSKEITFARKLLVWSDTNGREFPWRKTKDPYRIWLAEALLQRTRAETVANEFHTIVKTFPDLNSLRKARLSKIRKAIWRLGLIHRASYLKDAATYITSHFGGNFPTIISLETCHLEIISIDQLTSFIKMERAISSKTSPI